MDNVTFNQLGIYYEHGTHYDLERRGYTFKDNVSKDEVEEMRDFYYTKEQIESQNKALKEMYGNIDSELKGGA